RPPHAPSLPGCARVLGRGPLAGQLVTPSAAERVRGADLARVVARSFLLQALWNPERQQGAGFAFALKPFLTRVPPPQGEPAALARHVGYFNTNPAFASYALGAIGRLEVERALGSRLRPRSWTGPRARWDRRSPPSATL